jgi:hypothetical protein
MTTRYLSALFMVVALTGCGGGGSDGGLDPFYIPTDVIVVDIDNNGLPDILVLASFQTGVTTQEGRLVVYRQYSPAAFSSPETYVVGTYPWQFSIEDIDGDGAKDVAIADAAERLVYIVLQDPANPGLLLAPVKLPGSITHYGVVLADLNNDGLIDIVTADEGADRLAIHYQDPATAGTFRVANYPLAAPPVAMATGDLDADGLTDILVAVGDGLAYILQGTGGQLGQAVYVAPESGLIVDELTIADYDGNNHNDILVHYTPCCTGVDPLIRVLLQSSAAPGTFMPPVDTSLVAINGRSNGVFEDLDSDDLPDAATIGMVVFQCPTGGGQCTVQSWVNLFLQSGGGSFYSAQTYQLPLHAGRIAAGDLNLDGANDLILYGVDINGSGDLQVSALYQSTVTPGTFGALVIIGP